jgi:hypothetical protein
VLVDFGDPGQSADVLSVLLGCGYQLINAMALKFHGLG